MNLQVIKTKVEEIKYPGGIKALAEAVGMSEQNLHMCVRENKIQAQDLEKISTQLKVSIIEFFDEEEISIKSAGRDFVERGKIEHNGTEYNGASSLESDLRDQIAILKSQLEDKERIIKLLENSLIKS